jgi:hypothetical protein
VRCWRVARRIGARARHIFGYPGRITHRLLQLKAKWQERGRQADALQLRLAELAEQCELRNKESAQRAHRLEARLHQLAEQVELGQRESARLANDLEMRLHQAAEQVELGQRELARLANDLEMRLHQLVEQVELGKTESAQRAHGLEMRVDQLTNQLDLAKSRAEVSPELFTAFQHWKATTSLPAAPLVSVCVITFNRAHLLTSRCLPSILAQTYKRLEVIVIGDGCTDDTAVAVAALQDPRVRFENLPTRGVYPTDPDRRWMVAGCVPMNRALSLCQGDFITHLDDDDEFVPDRIERLTSFAQAQQCDFVWHPFWYESSQGEWAINLGPELKFGSVTTSAIFYRAWLKNVPSDMNAHLLAEPGDWNRIRRMKYLGAVCARYPEPLTRHYRERQNASA